MAFVVESNPPLKSLREKSLWGQSPKHTEPKECLASLKSFCPRDLKTCYTWGLWILQPVRRRILSIQEPLWIAGERSLWRFGSLPWRLTRVIGWGLGILSSRGIRWRHGLLSWISASLTRRIVVTATRTRRTHLCPSEATGSIAYLSLLTVFLCEVICLLALSAWLRCVTICSDWLHTIFHPDLDYLAAISLRAFTVLNTWLRLI